MPRHLINRAEHRHVYEHLLEALNDRLRLAFEKAYDLEATQGTFDLMLSLHTFNGSRVTKDEAVLLTAAFVLSAALGVEARNNPWAKKMHEQDTPQSNA